MIKLLPIWIVIVFGEITFADTPNLVPYTHAQEKEVKSFITTGMDEKEVVKKFGPPNLMTSEKDGAEVLQYLAPPPKNGGYAGFEVFLTDKKVTDVEIIRAGAVRKS